MKKNKKYGKKSKVPVILGLMILASGLFLTTKAVERIQDNRSSAASVSIAGSCLVYKEAMGNNSYYAINGSTFCGSNGDKNIYKCVSGKRVAQTTCKESCVENKTSVKDAEKKYYYKYSGKCVTTTTPPQADSKKSKNLYFYDPSTKNCQITMAYSSVDDCNSAKRSACYTSVSSCNASFSRCTNSKGTCILTSSGCSGGSFKSGLCPGNTTIKCCVKK